MNEDNKQILSLLFPFLSTAVSFHLARVISPLLFFVFLFGIFTIYYTAKNHVDMSNVVKLRICLLFIEILPLCLPFMDIPLPLGAMLGVMLFSPIFSIVINHFFVIFMNRNILDSKQKIMIFLSDPAFHYLLCMILILTTFW